MKRIGVADPIIDETDLIQTYLAPLAAGMPGAYGLGDDAASLTVPSGHDLVVSTDPIAAGVHFFADDKPEDIAWKALAVNVSDLVAKGAEPHAYTMALSFPNVPERAWMAAFAAGLADAQRVFGCSLIGGDTDCGSGPLSIGVTAIGFAPSGRMIPRRGAKAGDRVFVTGTIGDSALGLHLRRDANVFGDAVNPEERTFLVGRYLRPVPRVALVAAVRTYARAALDISDGFVKDLGRLTGELGIDVDVGNIPLSEAARSAMASARFRLDDVLNGGDDYEVLVAVPGAKAEAFARVASELEVAVRDLGTLKPSGSVQIIGYDGQAIEIRQTGFDHFRTQ